MNIVMQFWDNLFQNEKTTYRGKVLFQCVSGMHSFMQYLQHCNKKTVLSRPNHDLCIMMANTEELPDIELRHLADTDIDAFVNMVDDPAIKEYFEELNEDKEKIRYKFSGLNERPAFVQYWCICMPDGQVAGFISLKKSLAIFKTLEKKIQPPVSDIWEDFVLETDSEVKKREWLETVKAPYSSDVAIHPHFRRMGIGRAALLKLHDYAASVNLKEVYFEVRKDNLASAKLITGMSPELVATANEHYGHDLYHLPISWKPLTHDEMRDELMKLETTDEKKLYNHWRQIVIAIPELTPHRELVIALFKAILAEGATLDMKEEYASCHHILEWLEKRILISLKKRSDPLTIIWSIAHEYGHLLQKEAIGDEKKLYSLEKFKREEDAWKKAEEWLNDKPFFIFNWRDFFRFRHDRLNNYLSLPD